ncbi:hypothetical protein EDC04DRAFT_2912426 [Pisolithus marmoratus]|nr:hypothetical protein EDC04DRAFT_2912426 [Pisolithus marmoratus]
MFNYLASKFQDPTPISIPNKKPVEAPSNDEMQDKLKESCMKPSELSMELPSQERPKEGHTEARGKNKAEAAVGAAQQVLSRSINVEEYQPTVPSEQRMAQNELHEQLSLRAGEPLECKHKEVLSRSVEELDKIEDVDRKAKLGSEPAECASGVDKGDAMAHKDLPWILCNGSTMNIIPNTHGLPLKGEWASCVSDNAMNTVVDEHADRSNGHTNGPCSLTDTLSTSNEEETVVVVPQTCDDDAGAHGDETDSLGICTNMSSSGTDTLSAAHDTKIASNARQNIGTRQTTGKIQGLPGEQENESPDPTTPWK